MTLKKLIEISNLEIEDDKQRLFVELAILEDKKVSEIKQLSPEQIDMIIDKYKVLYTNQSAVEPSNSFIMDGEKYKLPITLKGKPYALFEDIELIMGNEAFGITNWEKLPYLIHLLTTKEDITGVTFLENLREDSRKFLNMGLEDALKVSAFFLTYENNLLVSLFLYSKMMAKHLLQTKWS